jgi:hypothetical protein
MPGRIGQTCPDVILGQLGEIAKDLLMRLTGSEPSKYICNGDPHIADARRATALA